MTPPGTPNLTGFEDMEDDMPVSSGNYAIRTTPLYREPCKKCEGTGVWRGGYSSGQCFGCGGKGYNEFKTSSEYRTKEREKSAQRKTTNIEAKRAAWVTANKDEAAWIEAKKDSFGFAGSLSAALEQYGSLTENQTAAVQRCILKDAEREVLRHAESAARESRKEEINIAKIEESFKKANQRLKFPTLRLDGFNFSLAGANSRNAGAIYVKQDGGTYLGKVLQGQFSPARECTPDLQAAVVAACEDPEGAAVRYGRLTGRCAICNHKLVDPVSVARGIGPICAGNYGW